MADEVRITAGLVYNDSVTDAVGLQIADLLSTAATTRYVRGTLAVTTTEVPIPLGNLAALGWAIFVNRDPTNYLEIRSASGAANDVVKIPAGRCALFHFGSDVTAPYAIANTATCKMEYLIVNL